MKHLIEISKIVTKKKVRKIEIFDDHSLKHKNSKFNEFYEALMASKFKNDRDAATFLYDCSPIDDRYRQLKSRFRKRLLNTLFFLDVNLPSTSNYDRAYYSVNKDWTLVKILLANNANHTAASLARQILTIALKFKFADVIVNCSRILRRYVAESSNEKAYEEYDEYCKTYQNILDAEISSEELYQRVVMNYLKISPKNNDLQQQVDQYCNDLVSLSESFDSPVVTYNMYMVWALRYEMLSDFDAMLEVCNKAETYIEDNPLYYQDDKLAMFQMKKMSAYLQLQDWKQGKINAEKCLKSFPEGSDTWFTFMEYYLLLAIHTENYINAVAIFNKAFNHSKFRRLPAIVREKWKVFDIFINYIIESQGQDNPVLRSQRRKTFKPARFLNDPLNYPKDQRVFMVLLTIAQFLFFLEKNSFNRMTETIETLKTYANRQLKKEEYFRSIQFIRLLQQLAKAEFDVESLSNTEKYYDRLIQTPFFYRGLLPELEVIPYEKLWKIVLSRLK